MGLGEKQNLDAERRPALMTIIYMRFNDLQQPYDKAQSGGVLFWLFLFFLVTGSYITLMRKKCKIHSKEFKTM